MDNDCSGFADDGGVCGAPVAEAPLSGVVADTFNYAGGTFSVSVEVR